MDDKTADESRRDDSSCNDNNSTVGRINSDEPYKLVMHLGMDKDELESAYIDGDETVTVVSTQDVNDFETVLNSNGDRFSSLTGGIICNMVVNHHVNEPYDPFSLHMLTSDDTSDNGNADVNKVGVLKTIRFQLDNGSAMTATPHQEWVEGYITYPQNKRPTLTG